MRRSRRCTASCSASTRSRPRAWRVRPSSCRSCCSCSNASNVAEYELMRRRLALLCVLAMAWPVAARSDDPSAALQARMTGHFRVAESDDVLQQRMAAAIELAIEPMSFIARPIARSRLRSVVYYCRQYEMALDAQTVHVACDDRPRIDRRLDNTEGPVAGLQPKPVDVKAQVGADSVELTIAGADGTRITTYRFGDGGALEVSVKVASPSLERPVAWKVLYRRAE